MFITNFIHFINMQRAAKIQIYMEPQRTIACYIYSIDIY